MPSNVKRYSTVGWTMVADWDDLAADIGTVATALNNYKATDLATHVSAGAPPVFPTAINGIIPKDGDLYINKTAMTLYQAVSGTWGAVLGTWVGAPAHAGIRGDDPNAAKFGHINFAANAIGFSSSSGGTNLIVHDASLGTYFYDYSGAGGYRLFGHLKWQDYWLDPWRLGYHPAHGPYAGLWLNGDPSSGNYALLKSGGLTLINGSEAVEIRVGNVTKLTANADGVTFTGSGGGGAINCTTLTASGAISGASLSTSGNITGGNIGASGSVSGVGLYGQYLNSSGGLDAAGTITGGVIVSNGNVQGRVYNDGNWQNWQILSNPSSGPNSICGSHLPGVAASGWRVCSSAGDILDAVGYNATQWVPTRSLGHSNMSTATIKRDIRSLRPHRERITAKRDSAADEVEVPDIMALRPVAFRYKRPAQHPDGSEFDGILGFESKRERLGLIAEETQYVIPSAVGHDVDGNAMGIDYAQVTVALLDHVQRLTDEVATLRYRITELEGDQP